MPVDVLFFKKPLMDPETGGAIGGSSATSSAPLIAPTEYGDEGDDDDFLETYVPQEYRSAKWLEPITRAENPQLELFKQMEGLQKKLGERPQGLTPPTDKSTPEEIANWNKAIGVPEKPDAYEYEALAEEGEDAEIIKYLNANRNDEFINSMKAAAHKLGIPADKFKALAREYDQAFISSQKAALQQGLQEQQLLDSEFEQLGEKFFGNRWQQVADNGKNMIQKLAPAELMPFVSQLDNKSLIVMAGVLDAFAKRYIREDGAFNARELSGASGMTAAEFQKRGTELLSNPSYSDPLAADHKQAVDAVQRHFQTGPYDPSRKR